MPIVINGTTVHQAYCIVDTILLLRLTQSTTVFLQQLGGWLRRAEGKAVLTVPDFIGQQRREFRFDLRYRALTGYGRKELEKAVEDEFPYRPSGSQILLDRVAQKVVLDNIKTQLRFKPGPAGPGHCHVRRDRAGGLFEVVGE